MFCCFFFPRWISRILKLKPGRSSCSYEVYRPHRALQTNSAALGGVQLIVFIVALHRLFTRKVLRTAARCAAAKLCNFFPWKKRRISSALLRSFQFSFNFRPSLSAVNSPPRCSLDQNTLLAHRLGLFSFSSNSITSTPSSPVLSIPSIGNLSASHLRHPILGRQLHRVLNKHKQRMEWLLER